MLNVRSIRFSLDKFVDFETSSLDVRYHLLGLEECEVERYYVPPPLVNVNNLVTNVKRKK